MTPGTRKVALTAHITSSVGWLGAVAGFEGLAVTGLASHDALKVRAAYLAMDETAWFVIMPFAFASLLTGLVLSLGGKWGLFNHYWIVAKFLINTLAIVLLLVHTRLIGRVASAAAESAAVVAEMRGLKIQVAATAGAALLALLVATTLAVYKPRGMTPYGRRRRKLRCGPSKAASAPPLAVALANATNGAGRRFGVKLAVAAIGGIVLLAIALHLVGGGHGSHGH